jgi:hypothetical protein
LSVDLDLQENASELAIFERQKNRCFGDITKERLTNFSLIKKSQENNSKQGFLFKETYKSNSNPVGIF